MRIIELPSRQHRCWNDHRWRRKKLDECVAIHTLSHEEISKLTGANPVSVKVWLGNHKSWIGRNTLRLLILELNNRAA